jgi:hypothetical protein
MKTSQHRLLEDAISQLYKDEEIIKQQREEIESLRLRLSESVPAHIWQRTKANETKFREQVIDTCKRAEKAEKQLAQLKDIVDQYMNGDRTILWQRDELGRFVREAWVRWAKTQPNPKPSWLVDYDDLDEADKEADRQIGEVVARWVIISDAATFTRFVESKLTNPVNS